MCRLWLFFFIIIFLSETKVSEVCQAYFAIWVFGLLVLAVHVHHTVISFAK